MIQNYNLHTHTFYSDGKSQPREMVEPARQFCMDHCRSYWSYRADADFSFTQKPGMVLRTDRAVCRSIDRFYALNRLHIQRYA